MANPGTHNLVLQRRADHSFDVNLKDSNNANENLTGKTILSFIISITTIAAGYAGYRYITSPQFEAMMMEKVMEGVGKILPNQIDKKMPKVTGPMLPL